MTEEQKSDPVTEANREIANPPKEKPKSDGTDRKRRLERFNTDPHGNGGIW